MSDIPEKRDGSLESITGNSYSIQDINKSVNKRERRQDVIIGACEYHNFLQDWCSINLPPLDIKIMQEFNKYLDKPTRDFALDHDDYIMQHRRFHEDAAVRYWISNKGRLFRMNKSKNIYVEVMPSFDGTRMRFPLTVYMRAGYGKKKKRVDVCAYYVIYTHHNKLFSRDEYDLSPADGNPHNLDLFNIKKVERESLPEKVLFEVG